MTWPFGCLRPLSFNVIACDPPWRFTNYSAKGERKGPAHHYQCMDLDSIKALPVGQLAAPDCLLWLWATNPMLNVAFDVMGSWGFKFKTAGHWVKRTKNGCLAFGPGYILRGAGEPFLIGTIGSPKTTRSCRSVVEGLAREHSRKPDEAYELIKRLMPGARRADLFSRETRPGWESWGDQSTKFNVEAA